MTKKRHHYIPQFYLKGFVDPSNEPFIWVYDKDTGEIIRSTARDIAVKRHYFSFINECGEKDSETIEDQIAILEREASSVISKIINCEPLNETEKGTFVVFVALMMVRTPNFRRNIEISSGKGIKKFAKFWASSKEGFTESIKKFEKETGGENIPIEELRQFMLAGNYEIKMIPQFSLVISLNLIKDFSNMFFNMKWAFCKASEYKYLSGDNPFYYSDPTHDRNSPYGVGLANNKVEVTLPLSKDMAAVGTWGGVEGYINAKNATIKEINKRTALATDRFMFSSEKSEVIKKFVMKFKDSSPRWRVS